MKIFDYNDEHVGATEGKEEGGGVESLNKFTFLLISYIDY